MFWDLFFFCGKYKIFFVKRVLIVFFHYDGK